MEIEIQIEISEIIQGVLIPGERTKSWPEMQGNVTCVLHVDKIPVDSETFRDPATALDTSQYRQAGNINISVADSVAFVFVMRVLLHSRPMPNNIFRAERPDRYVYTRDDQLNLNIWYQPTYYKEDLGPNTNKAFGSDGIPPIVLKKCAPELTHVLCKLFNYSYKLGIFPSNWNYSYKLGIFPSNWKIARVQPVPRKGKKTLPSNYRPIALLSIISKMPRSQTHSHLWNTVEKLAIWLYFIDGRCSSEILTIVPPLEVPARLTRRVEASRPFVVTLETCRTSLSKNSFIQLTARLWNTLPKDVFPEAYNLQKFKKNTNSYLISLGAHDVL
ncbi:unnamed protein product [Phaedon cochleariae]|uniref:Uncharacterized protein n=1 Tax=Phaedon cochleariae TaxID=80249 RepID=A0A9N9S924_PHACE|nr:unnamed protein product [Phaedon cochleariae]